MASKLICNDIYSNKSWSIVAQGMFSLREINQMEHEMCSYLEWELTVDNAILTNFQAMVKRDRPAHTSRACSAFARSTRWNTRCVLTSNGSSLSTTPSSPISRPSHILKTHTTPTMLLPHSRRRPPRLPQPFPPRHLPTARPLRRPTRPRRAAQPRPPSPLLHPCPPPRHRRQLGFNRRFDPRQRCAPPPPPLPPYALCR